MEKVAVFDLFSGPGGLGEGFSAFKDENQESPFQIVLSVEKDVSAHKTLTTRAFFRKIANNPKKRDLYNKYVRAQITREELFEACPEEAHEARTETLHGPKSLGKDNALIHGRIREISNSHKGPKILIGGPPCQAYSLAGRSRNAGNDKYNAEDDERHFLYKEYLSVLAILQPDIFVMENVRGILSSKVDGKLIFPDILKDLKNPFRGKKNYQGNTYKVFSLVEPSDFLNEDIDPKNFLIKTENYGIPQARHRVILLGIKQPSEIIPDILKTKNEYVTVQETIGDLPLLRSGFSKIKDNDLKWNECVINLLETAKNIVKAKFPAVKLSSLSVAPHPNLNRSSTKATYELTSLPTHLRDWITDTSLNYIANHETRGHLEADLLRYSFSATYAIITNGTSPKARDYPDALAPSHKNWNSGKHADRFRVQPANKYATTITSHISKDGHYFIHYDPQQCRSFTVREAARIQTFPDNYIFEGNRTNQYVQVGNAVPPYLALQIAEILHKVLLT
ncbi:MAG: DNA (cytosine-5)-methyltransferase 1 [Oleiphilaceae bacterium]|jgi:DNA (cytosine-5)-methyltransferase 1